MTIDGRPALPRELLEEWQLTPDGAPRFGRCAIVLPVRTAAGGPAALKVSTPHWEAELEHLALQHWRGDGAVRLLRADPRRFALLLERLHVEDLGGMWDVEACEVVASFYPRLHVPAGPQFVTLSSCVRRWVEGLRELPRDAPVPRRLVEQAVALGRDFLADERTDGRLIHTDLHYDNVLAADREPWLVIDPKPLSGDPHYEVAPLLWNRWAELTDPVGQGVRRGVRARFHATVDAAGLDEDRARDWVVFRMVANAMGEPDDADWVTRCVTIAKSVQE
ncbi:aminoglycoside phosphotransferase family protein [Nocardioides aquiterrae]|uniref:Streptomycin 6-kinase n=1 Tax=Nocardioides aquiterrae TaxID=203799 RepID=A0ABP4F424_9ACTN